MNAAAGANDARDATRLRVLLCDDHRLFADA